MTALGDVVGIVLHDTVTPPSLDERMIEWAHDGITQAIGKGKTTFVPGPLYNELVMRDGSHLVIAGDEKANHAGRINARRLSRLGYGQVPPPGRPAKSSDTTANARLYGIAWMRGAGEAVTVAAFAKMLDRCDAAIERFGLSPDCVWAHAELTRRKVDPSPAYSKTGEIRAALHARRAKASEPVVTPSSQHPFVTVEPDVEHAVEPNVEDAVDYLRKALRALEGT